MELSELVEHIKLSDFIQECAEEVLLSSLPEEHRGYCENIYWDFDSGVVHCDSVIDLSYYDTYDEVYHATATIKDILISVNSELEGKL